MTRLPPPPRTLGPDAELPVRLPLAAVEEADAWYVVVDGRDGDWVARFEKADGFDAKEWATSMARTFNARLHADAEDPLGF